MSAVQWRRLDLPYEVWEAGRGLVAARVFGADADLPGACVWRRGLLVMSTSRSSVEEAKAAVAGWCLALGQPSDVLAFGRALRALEIAIMSRAYPLPSDVG